MLLLNCNCIKISSETLNRNTYKFFHKSFHSKNEHNFSKITKNFFLKTYHFKNTSKMKEKIVEYVMIFIQFNKELKLLQDRITAPLICLWQNKSVQAIGGIGILFRDRARLGCDFRIEFVRR
ncbi:hypothetical protein BpHYR1_020678 [Brachionus plicatilis]|uniref:Uncharacterized protein n=1 Tax=Brachionus plicatilis TaxID=10195 RepID=A0A3M7T725_BRAPC|nr:hypothetical protein BpHYR1_020678 [Brachionus plicatilis]